MKEARIFKAWKTKVTGDLTNHEDPIVQASLRMFKQVTTTLEQTLLIAFLHETRLPPSQIEMLYSHSPEGMLVTVRQRAEAAKVTPLPLDEAVEEAEATRQPISEEQAAKVRAGMVVGNYGN